MRTPTEKDDASLRPPAQARATVAGLVRVLTVALVIAPLLALFVVVSAPGAVHASGKGHGITVAPDNGPAGTHVTVTGSNFPGNANVTVGYGSGGCASGVTTISGATGTTTDGGGNLNASFSWPSTPAGVYTVCVTVGGTTYPSDNTFTATTPNSPSITVTTPVAAGGQVTVTGSNFLLNGSQTAEVRFGAQGSNGCDKAAGTAPITNGSFTVTFNAPFVTQTTQYTVTAVTPEGSCGGTPVLSAQATLTVNAAATATSTVAPTATPGSGTSTTNPGSVGLTWPPTWPPSGAWSVVYCLVGLLLLLLLLLMLLLFARNRRRDEPVTIQERDNVTVQSSGAAGSAGGAGSVQRNIEAVDPRTGRRTVIAQDEYTFEEVPDDQQQP